MPEGQANLESRSQTYTQTHTVTTILTLTHTYTNTFGHNQTHTHSHTLCFWVSPKIEDSLSFKSPTAELYETGINPKILDHFLSLSLWVCMCWSHQLNCHHFAINVNSLILVPTMIGSFWFVLRKRILQFDKMKKKWWQYVLLY